MIYNSAFATKNSFNTANYKNPKMDALLARQQKSVSDAVRATAIKGILSLGANDLPYIPVWYDEIGMALNSKYKYANFGPWYLYTPWAENITTARSRALQRLASGPADEKTRSA